MPIDTSMYSMLRPIDIGGAIQQGLSLRDMADARVARQKAAQEQDQVKSAYDRAAIVDDQGNTTVDQNKLLSQLSGMSSPAARQAEQQIGQQRAQQLQQAHNEANFLAQTMGGVDGPESWERAKVKAQKAGLDISQYKDMPYDPAEVQRLYSIGVSARDRMEMDARAADRKDAREERRALVGMARQDRLDTRREKEAYARSPEGRLSKLNSGDKARYDNSRMGLQAIQSLDQALVDGNNTFSLVGDNDFTLNLDHAAEAFGRMQSGGAINHQEEARFKRMAPTATDSKGVQREKLQKMQKLFVDRLKTLGFTPEEADLQVQPIAYGGESKGADYANMSDEALVKAYNDARARANVAGGR